MKIDKFVMRTVNKTIHLQSSVRLLQKPIMFIRKCGVGTVLSEHLEIAVSTFDQYEKIQNRK
jgi:hypothetical protein